MNNELLLLIKKHTDIFFEQIKTKPQETLEFKMIRSKQTFLFSLPINLVEEGKWLLRVTSLECTNSVFKITDGNNSFSIILLGHYQTEFAEEIIQELNKLLELASLELHVKEVRIRGNKIKIGDNEYKLSDFDTQKNDTLDELRNVKYNDLEYSVYRMQLTYDEIMDILDLKHIATKKIGYTLKPNIYQRNDKNKTLKNISPDNVVISVSIDEKIYKSNFQIKQTLIFTNKVSFIPYLVLLGHNLILYTI